MSGDARMDATTIFDRSVPGRGSARFPAVAGSDRDAAVAAIPAHLRRAKPPRLPEVAESEVVRHYTRLSQRNFSIDTGFYPLGSCTMKYNPKVHERIASLPGFADLHPLQQEEGAQGTLELLWRLQGFLAEIAGLPSVSLQPAAGAHGEFAGLLVMRAHHEARGGEMPTHVLIPDTAHGTNPATVTMAGFSTISIPTDERGGMDLDAVKAACATHPIVGLMLTNPNTLGLFDERIGEIAKVVHQAGGLLYYDGANLNAIMGIARPGDMGFDIVHFNTHKSFSTPHGGGGPGAGPIAVRQDLERFLPRPFIVRREDGSFAWSADEGGVGPIKSFWGNVGVLVRAYAYIRTLGRDGLREAAETAVLNANYLLRRLSPAFEPLYGRTCMHEFVVSAGELKRSHSVRALDLAKRLIDHGFHPPTMYFPLLVDEALMIEPTETESRETLDAFADALLAVVQEARDDPATVRAAPHTATVRRVDETRAARQPVLRWGTSERMQDASPVRKAMVTVTQESLV